MALLHSKLIILRGNKKNLSELQITIVSRSETEGCYMKRYLSAVEILLLILIIACSSVTDNTLTKAENQIVLECVDNYMKALLNKDAELLANVLVGYVDGRVSLGPEDAKSLALLNVAFGIESYRIMKIRVKREINKPNQPKVILIAAELKLKTRDGNMKSSLPVVYDANGKYCKVLAPGISKMER